MTINREDLVQVMMGEITLVDQIAAGKVTLDGDASILTALAGMMDHFEMGFEILPGTGGADLTPEHNPFEMDTPANTSGG